ncbi:MAG: N-acetyltransferase [Corynebacterium sp.]|nr:N-acetyltransferase [Corynebacterium sp.]
MDKTLDIAPINIDFFIEYVTEFVEIYSKAMKDAFDYEADENIIAAMWRRDTRMPGFKAFECLDQGTPVGFVYGFDSVESNFWNTIIRRTFMRTGRMEEWGFLLDNTFQVSELHVLPEYQGRGIGRALLSHLIKQTEKPYAILSTPENAAEATAAFKLYRKMGFKDFARDFTFPGDSRKFALLYLDVPAYVKDNPGYF